MLTQDQLKQNIDSMQSQGAKNEDIQSYLDSMKGKIQMSDAGADSGSDTSKPGIFQSIAQGVAKPVLKMVSGLEQGVGNTVAAGARLTGNTKFADDLTTGLNQQDQEGVDYGYFGKVKAVGSGFDINKGFGDNLRPLADAVGTGAEVASYMAAPLKGTPTTWLLALNPVTAAKLVAPFAIPFSVGKALEAVGEGKGAGEAAVTGVENYAVAALSFGLLRSGGTLLNNWGSSLLKSGAGQAAMNGMASLAEKIKTNLFSSGEEQTGKALTYLNSAYQKQFDEDFGKAVDSTIDNMKVQAPTGEMALTDLQRSVGNKIGAAYTQKNMIYSDVFNADNGVRVTGFDNTQAALDKTNEYVDSFYRTTPTAKAPNALINYQQLIDGVVQNAEKKGGVDAETIDRLVSSANPYAAASDKEANMINDISHSLMDDFRSHLQANHPDLVNRLDEANSFWKNVTQNIDSGVAGKFRRAATMDNFVDDFTSMKVSRPAMREFVDSFSKEDKPVFSQMVYNSLLDKAKVMAKDGTPQDAAAMIDKFLTKSGDMIDPRHASQLETLGDFMKSNFDDFVNGVKTLPFEGEQGAGQAGSTVYHYAGGANGDLNKALEAHSIPTVGEGHYYSETPGGEAANFGDNQTTHTLSDNMNLYDASKQTGQGQAFTSLADDPLYKQMLKDGKSDFVSYAKGKGYDGVKFPSDTGDQTWIATHSELPAADQNTAADLAAQKATLKGMAPIQKMATSGQYNKASDAFFQLDSATQSKVTSQLSEEDRFALGNGMIKKVLDDNTTLFDVNKDGKYDFSGIFKDLNKLNPDVVSNYFPPEQQQLITDLMTKMQQVKAIDNVSKGAANKIIQSVMATVEAAKGWWVPAGYHAGRAVLSGGSNATEEGFQTAVSQLLSERTLPDSVMKGWNPSTFGVALRNFGQAVLKTIGAKGVGAGVTEGIDSQTGM